MALERQAEVAVLDGGGGSWRVVRRKRVPPGPHNLASSGDGLRIAVSSPPAGRVTLLDSAGRIDASAAIAGGPHDLEFTPDSRALWVTAERGRRLVKLDAGSGRRLQVRTTGGSPHDLAISPDGRRLWVTIDGSAAVEVRSARTGALLGRARVGGGPHDLAFDPEGKRVWLSNFASPRLTVASVRTGRRLGSVRAGAEPHHFAFDRGRLWISDNGGGALLSLETASRAVRRRTQVGSAPHHVAVTGSEVLVAMNGGGRVAVVSRAGRVRSQVPVGAGPHGIAAIRLLPSQRGAGR